MCEALERRACTRLKTLQFKILSIPEFAKEREWDIEEWTNNAYTDDKFLFDLTIPESPELLAAMGAREAIVALRQ